MDIDLRNAGNVGASVPARAAASVALLHERDARAYIRSNMNAGYFFVLAAFFFP